MAGAFLHALVLVRVILGVSFFAQHNRTCGVWLRYSPGGENYTRNVNIPRYYLRKALYSDDCVQTVTDANANANTSESVNVTTLSDDSIAAEMKKIHSDDFHEIPDLNVTVELEKNHLVNATDINNSTPEKVSTDEIKIMLSRLLDNTNIYVVHDRA